jgi:NAD(P)H-nitrite reductase large subunit
MARFQNSYEVCHCQYVTLGEIICVIRNKNAQTIKDIGDITGAGTICGCCKNDISDFGTSKMRLHLDYILSKLVS